jgi:F-type H+-transporting ATPase subunit delta
MAELATLARPYARAVFELAKSQGQLDRWSRTLGLLAAVGDDPRVGGLIESPDLPAAVKAERLAGICGPELDDRGRQLVRLLAINKRLAVIGELKRQFEEFKAQEERVLDVEVISAFDLTGEQAEMLREALRGRFRKEVNLTSRVERNLIGGAVIRAGDTVIDGSIRGKLERLAETLQRI